MPSLTQPLTLIMHTTHTLTHARHASTHSQFSRSRSCPGLTRAHVYPAKSILSAIVDFPLRIELSTHSGGFSRPIDRHRRHLVNYRPLSRYPRSCRRVLSRYPSHKAISTPQPRTNSPQSDVRRRTRRDERATCQPKLISSTRQPIPPRPTPWAWANGQWSGARRGRKRDSPRSPSRSQKRGGQAWVALEEGGGELGVAVAVAGGVGRGWMKGSEMGTGMGVGMVVRDRTGRRRTPGHPRRLSPTTTTPSTTPTSIRTPRATTPAESTPRAPFHHPDTLTNPEDHAELDPHLHLEPLRPPTARANAIAQHIPRRRTPLRTHALHRPVRTPPARPARPRAARAPPYAPTRRGRDSRMTSGLIDRRLRSGVWVFMRPSRATVRVRVAVTRRMMGRVAWREGTTGTVTTGSGEVAWCRCSVAEVNCSS